MSVLEDELEGAPGFTAAPSADQSQKLTNMGVELMELDIKITELEDALEKAKARKLVLTQKDMVEYLQVLGQDKVGLPNYNVDLVLEAFYHANIKADWPEEQRESAFQWLEDSDNGDIIKLEMNFSFSRGQLNVANWMKEQIEKLEIPHEFKVNRLPEPVVLKNVPWNTLTAFVKREVEAGHELPMEKLGATMGSVVKIKPRDKSTRKRKN